jgi:phosphoglycerol transferase MdoB-like AlkP superfamily enzyme
VIQTASNHRPYTIPASDTDFRYEAQTDAELQKNGFASLREFNGFRYLDYSLKKYFEMARKEAYFDNTIFVLFGDHGISGQTGAHMPLAYSALDLAQVHTPFVVYAPKLVRPQKIDRIVQQVDVLPTILGRLNLPYRNSALGRDAFVAQGAHYGFMINHANGPELTVFDDQYLLRHNLGTQKSSLHRYLEGPDVMRDLSAQEPQTVERLRNFALAYYYSAQHLLGHNARVP